MVRLEGRVMAKFDSRKLMEKAIDVMRESVSEPRSDGKASPMVGAVLWKPGGSVETACRGELRYGDHAEYTLLERKNRHCRLDGAILFATLEPCAPGSRRHPRLGCAESVHMFDRDLQEVIRKENKSFIAQAMERAATAREEKPKTVTLSPLENVSATAEIQDLSTKTLEQYRSIAKITDKVGTPGFNRRLSQQGLLKDENGRLVPTGFGILLFGRKPRTIMPQAGLLGTMHYSSGKEEPMDFDGPQVLAPSQALKWLREKLPNPIDRSESRRREANEAFFELAREGIVNALVHRDYEIKEAKCQLVVTQDIITVKSPGGPLPPITLEQMQSFTAPMLSRNPVLHYVFAKMELAEERGLGLKSMRNRAHSSGLPLPKYSWENPYLVLRLYSTPAAALTELGDKVLDVLSKAERLGWKWLVNRETATSAQYSAAMQVPNRTALNHLKRFADLGLVRKIGSGRATWYEVNRP